MFSIFKRQQNGLFSAYNLDKFINNLTVDQTFFIKDETLKAFPDLNEESFTAQYNKKNIPSKQEFILKMSKRFANKKEFSFATSILEIAADSEKNADTKHLYLNELIEVLYKQRDDEAYLSKCKDRCLQDMKLIKKQKVDDREPISFKRMAIILESEGNTYEALKVSKHALELGLHDGTKTGYEGRIQKLSN